MNRQTVDRTESAVLREFCSGLLLCQNNIRTYPREHPRVDAALELMRQVIGARHRETGRRLSIDTSFLEELGSVHGSAPATRTFASLARLLKLHLIQEVTMDPDVPKDELYEFSCLLREDLLRAPEERQDSFDPCAWKFIEISFCIPQDFPDSLDGTLLSRAAGLSRVEELDKLLEELPEHLASRLRDALVSPAFLRRISHLRRKLRGRVVDESRDSSEAPVDVIATTVRSVLEKVSSRGAAHPQTSQDLLSILDDSLRCVEDELGSPESDGPELETEETAAEFTAEFQELRRVFQVAQSEDDPPDEMAEIDREVQSILDTADVEPALEGVLDTPDVEPALENIPRTDDVEPAVETMPDTGDVEPALESLLDAADAEPAAEGALETPPTVAASVASLEERFGDIRYEGNDFEGVLDLRDNASQYLDVLLELLRDPACETTIRKNWSAVLDAIAGEMNDDAFRETAVRHVATSSKERKITAGDEMLALMLESVDSLHEVHRAFEDTIVRGGGEGFATRTLDRMIQRRPKKALDLLIRVHRTKDPATPSEVREHAESSLISLSTNSSLLESWAKEYPEGLLEPRVFAQIVDRETPERLLEVFKQFFMHAPPRKSLKVLRLLTKDLPGLDYILTTSIQYGPSEVHDHALRFLREHRIPGVTRTLIQTVRLNNYRDHPSMREVEAALDALARIDDPGAREFLEQVESSRSGWLSYEFRKEIRSAAKNTIRRGGAS